MHIEPIPELIDREDLSRLDQLLWNLRQFVQEDVFGALRRVVGTDGLPAPIKSVLIEIDRLKERLRELPPAHLRASRRETGLFRAAVVRERLQLARDVETRIGFTFDLDLQRELRERLKPFDDLIARDWCARAERVVLPRLSDFMPLKLALQRLGLDRAPPRVHVFDEKFGILSAPGSLLGDLDDYRSLGVVRDIRWALAFLDIDDFKKLNEEYLNDVVDQLVLPAFMRCVEAHIFSRGHAYRFGGDEYAVLLFNAGEHEAIEFMDALRRKIAELSYGRIPKKTTVSIGVVCGDTSSHLTSYEAYSLSVRASKYAKKEGKNRVAAFKEQLYSDDYLYTARS